MRQERKMSLLIRGGRKKPEHKLKQTKKEEERSEGLSTGRLEASLG